MIHLFLVTAGLLAHGPVDLKDYRTVDKAVVATPKQPAPARSGQTGYLGVLVGRDQGRLVIEEVQLNSAAAKAGLLKGDRILRINGQTVTTPEAFREALQTRGPDEAVKLSLERAGKPVEVSTALSATSKPLSASGQRGRSVYLGVQLGEAKEGQGVRLDRVTTGSPAEAAGLKSGDRIMKIDGADFTRPSRLDDILAEKKAGDAMALVVKRDGKDVQLKATLGERGRNAGRDFGPPAPWKKNVFRLAVVGFEFADVKHNAKVPLKEWEELFFSRGKYTNKMNATGQSVYGSLNDYFHEQSAGVFHIEGKVFEWVTVGKKRGDYVQGSGTSNKTAPLSEALEKLTARDGKDALKGFDGILFIYAGDRVQTNRGTVYYPHSGQVAFQSRRTPYLLGPEGSSRMSTISAFVKEFGRVIGLPDLAARSENAGSEGLGIWCAMSNPLGVEERGERGGRGSRGERSERVGTPGRPQHLGAWAKEKMGWLKPVAIDPSVKQKLVLAPIETSPKDCVKVLVRPDGSEYFLLENRGKKAFDADLPGEGLLIWRVVHDRPILEESHGVEGPSGPLVHLSSVPYPSPSNTSFTRETTPSSRSPLGGGLPVNITEIRRLPDGRIAFQVGYEYR